jgi:hypothetical protein
MTSSLRLPRGLLQDLEETVIHQDRQFLTEVARSLGLPVQEVLRKCLGTGSIQKISTLWAFADEDGGAEIQKCPWWDCYGDGLWKPCIRHRLAPALPCYKHEQCTTNTSFARLASDPYIQTLRHVRPVLLNETLYWTSLEENTHHFPFREDGSIDRSGVFHYIMFKNRRILVWNTAQKGTDL